MSSRKESNPSDCPGTNKRHSQLKVIDVAMDPELPTAPIMDGSSLHVSLALKLHNAPMMHQH